MEPLHAKQFHFVTGHPYSELGGIDDRESVFRTFPELMSQLSGGRMLQDWTRQIHPIWPNYRVWKNMWTDNRANLDQLVENGIWKLHVVTHPIEIFEDGQFKSETNSSLFSVGAVVVVEWIDERDMAVCRITCPPLWAIGDRVVPAHGYTWFSGCLRPLKELYNRGLDGLTVDEFLLASSRFGGGAEEEAGSAGSGGQGEGGSSSSAVSGGGGPSGGGTTSQSAAGGGSAAGDSQEGEMGGPSGDSVPSTAGAGILSQRVDPDQAAAAREEAIIRLMEKDDIFTITPLGSHISPEQSSDIMANDYEARMNTWLPIFSTRKTCLVWSTQKSTFFSQQNEDGSKAFVEFNWHLGGNEALEGDELRWSRLYHEDEVLLHAVSGRFAYVTVVKRATGSSSAAGGSSGTAKSSRPATAATVSGVSSDPAATGGDPTNDVLMGDLRPASAVTAETITSATAVSSYSDQGSSRATPCSPPLNRGWLELVSEDAVCHVRFMGKRIEEKHANPYFATMTPETMLPGYVIKKGVSPPPSPPKEPDMWEDWYVDTWITDLPDPDAEDTQRTIFKLVVWDWNSCLEEEGTDYRESMSTFLLCGSHHVVNERCPWIFIERGVLVNRCQRAMRGGTREIDNEFHPPGQSSHGHTHHMEEGEEEEIVDEETGQSYFVPKRLRVERVVFNEEDEVQFDKKGNPVIWPEELPLPGEEPPTPSEISEAEEVASVDSQELEAMQEPPHILPILLQMSGMADRARSLEEFKECVDPIWGRKYFLNIWTSEIFYNIDHRPEIPFVRMYCSFVVDNMEPAYFQTDHRGGRNLAKQRLRAFV